MGALEFKPSLGPRPTTSHRLDVEALRAAGPRHLVGFSDVTALHGRIGRQRNQVTIHGPGVGSVAQLRDRSSADSYDQPWAGPFQRSDGARQHSALDLMNAAG